MSQALRLAFVADIHHGDNSFTKVGVEALPLMEEFRRFVGDARPDAVIDLGDRISDRDHETDLRLEQEVADAFAPIMAPRFHLCGNHDRDHLSVAENEAILGQPLGHRVVDLGEWRLVFWAADSKIYRPGGFVLREADLLWLAATVDAADRPLAIMSHVPVSGHSQIGNYYFERNPASSTYPGAERARAVLSRARVPVVCLSGHVHWNTLTTVDGIPHLTLQSLTESFTTGPEPAGAFALLELGETISWVVYGKDPFTARFTAAQTLRRWMTPLQRFEEHPELRLRTPLPSLSAESPPMA
ncbi:MULTISPECIES: metallophosphoesterase [unclassified Chelatococcus]|uniref:metallophosphoesterase family protein n=1 Tax=unclassified Chelatococcus TaxID=2638111 RepID=UPI001BCBC8A8|nr:MULTISPECIES: metallophosphoesterase [unclassified Chelatococcus]MBS7697009.1 metallophosphoesterase [Chelatococcus sp. YT9]MBX3555999.1 metallophosphoesterase [Chelatococcus sp.]